MTQLENSLLNLSFSRRSGGQNVNPGRQISSDVTQQIGAVPDMTAANELALIASSIRSAADAATIAVAAGQAISEKRNREQEGEAEINFRVDAERYKAMVDEGDIEYGVMSPEEIEAEADRLISDRTAGMSQVQAEYYRKRAKPWLMSQIGGEVDNARDAAELANRDRLLARAVNAESPEVLNDLRSEYIGSPDDFNKLVLVPALEDAANQGDATRVGWLKEQLGDSYSVAQIEADRVLEQRQIAAQQAQSKAYVAGMRDVAIADVEQAKAGIEDDYANGLIDGDTYENAKRAVLDISNLEDAFRRQADQESFLVNLTRHNRALVDAGNTAGIVEQVGPNGEKISRRDQIATVAMQMYGEDMAGTDDLSPPERAGRMIDALARIQREFGDDFQHPVIQNLSREAKDQIKNLDPNASEETKRAAIEAMQPVFGMWATAMSKGYTGLAQQLATTEMHGIFRMAQVASQGGAVPPDQALLRAFEADRRIKEAQDNGVQFTVSPSDISSEIFSLSDADEVMNLYRFVLGRFFGDPPDQPGDVGYEDIKNTQYVTNEYLMRLRYYYAMGEGVTSMEDAKKLALDDMKENMMVVNGWGTTIPPGMRPDPQTVRLLYEYGPELARGLDGIPEEFDANNITFRINPLGRFEAIYVDGPISFPTTLGSFSRDQMYGMLEDAAIARQRARAGGDGLSSEEIVDRMVRSDTPERRNLQSQLNIAEIRLQSRSFLQDYRVLRGDRTAFPPPTPMMQAPTNE